VFTPYPNPCNYPILALVVVGHERQTLVPRPPKPAMPTMNQNVSGRFKRLPAAINLKFRLALSRIQSNEN
jgi:hypothetical protein